MSSHAVPLSILDLAPISAGRSAADAVANTLDLARRADELGYRRYWLAEHHFAPGVASAAPAVLITAVAAATRRIRVGSGAVQLGHQTALSVVEQFGTIDALFPGRADLGLGRSGQRRAEAARELSRARRRAGSTGSADAAQRSADGTGKAGRTVDGLLIPPRFSPAGLLTSPRAALHTSLLQQPGAQPPDYGEQVADILRLLAGEYRSPDGIEAHVTPGEGARLDIWILGSSGGQSAQVAAAHGLPFAANYHVSPATVLEAVEAYRAAFRPSAWLAEPHVMVSADAVVADDDQTARGLAAPYGLWVRSIRCGAGAIPFPSPGQAEAHSWSEEDRKLVADRVDTQFVGSPATVAARLRTLQAATGADELLVTTITHEHADRVRSFELLARAWGLPGS